MKDTTYHKNITLNDQEKRQLKSAVEHLQYPQNVKNYDEYVFNAERAVRRGLSKRLLWQLSNMKTAANPIGTLLIKNLPVDLNLPATPSSIHYSHSLCQIPIAKSILVGISSILGFPVGYEEEKKGELVHDVFPIKETHKPLSNEGNVSLGLHVENAMFNNREKFIVLSCLKQDPMKQAITPVSDVRQALHMAFENGALNPADIIQLRKSEYQIRKPYILDQFPIVSRSEALPILSGSLKSPNIQCTFYHNGTTACTERAQVVLNKLKKAMYKAVNPVKLTPGDMVIINNYKVLHGRSQFKVFFDGNDRYLIRTYIMGDLQPVQDLQVSSNRILKRTI